MVAYRSSIGVSVTSSLAGSSPTGDRRSGHCECHEKADRCGGEEGLCGWHVDGVGYSRPELIGAPRFIELR